MAVYTKLSDNNLEEFFSKYNLGKVFDVSISTRKPFSGSVPTSVEGWRALMDKSQSMLVKVGLTKENIDRAEGYISGWKFRSA